MKEPVIDAFNLVLHLLVEHDHLAVELIMWVRLSLKSVKLSRAFPLEFFPMREKAQVVSAYTPSTSIITTSKPIKNLKFRIKGRG